MSPKLGRADGRQACAACPRIPAGTRRPCRRAGAARRPAGSSHGSASKSTSTPCSASSRCAFLQHRQRLEAEEVELHQPRRLDIFHVELGDRHVRARIAVERDQLVERAVADDHAGGVGRGVARQAFQLHRQVEQALDVGVVLILGGELARRRSASAPASTDRSDGWGSAWPGDRPGHSSSAARGRCP